MATKLNQIIAVEKGAKTRAFGEFRDIDKRLQRKELLTGISRTWRKRDEEGEELPPESQMVQVKVEDSLRDARTALSRLFDVVATKEWANTEARADIKIDGTVLVADVPVTYLLFLERELDNIRTFIARLPTLSTEQRWHYDSNVGAFASEPVETHRTKKVPRNHVKWVPPDSSFKQPAQVETFTEDVVVGYWTKIDYSGALPVEDVKGMLDRVEKLQAAVKYAREDANSREVEDVTIADAIFDYIYDSGE